MALQTWVARFVVDHGRVTEEGGRLRTFERRRIDEEDVDLHVLTEPAGEKGDELAAQALDAIGRSFLADRLSLTGGLLRSLKATHQTLADWNRRSLPRDQVSAGITAAIVSGTIVYLAQAGPSLAFLRHNGRLERLEPVGEPVPPLGEGEVEPPVRRIELAGGDMLIAASNEFESLMDEEALAALLDRGSDEAMPELYLLTKDQPNFALFAVTCHDDGEDAVAAAPEAPPPPEPPPPSTPPSQPRREPRSPRPEPERDDRDDIGGGIDEIEGFGLRKDATERELRGQPHNLNVTHSAPAPIATVWEPETIDAMADPWDIASTRRPDQPPPQPVPEFVTPKPIDISRPVIKLRNETSIGRSDYARTTGTASRFRLDLSDTKMLRVVGVIALVILVVAFVPGLVQESRGEKVEDLVQTAQAELTAATAQTDAGMKRVGLDETRRLATEALRIEPENAVAAELRRLAIEQLNELNAVVDLGELTPVATLSRQVTGEISISALSVGGETAYLLDSKGGRVIAVPLAGTGQPTTVYEDGKTYGSAQAKKPQLITWDSTDGRLLVLDAERKLFEVAPGVEPSPLPLRRTNTWLSVVGIAAYDGNFYVLDPRGNQVHRYLPAAEGFDSEPGPALAGQVSLADATAIAVSVDVYIFLKDGSVRRYAGGNEAGFGLTGLDREIRTGIGINVITAAEEVYLADSGNKRVVVAGTDGNFKRQFVSNSFTDMRAIGLDPNGARLYVVVADQLLAAPVPR